MGVGSLLQEQNITPLKIPTLGRQAKIDVSWYNEKIRINRWEVDSATWDVLFNRREELKRLGQEDVTSLYNKPRWAQLPSSIDNYLAPYIPALIRYLEEKTKQTIISPLPKPPGGIINPSPTENPKPNDRTITIEPIFNSRQSTVDENMVFVLMPFEKEWSDDLWGILRSTISDAGFRAVRAKELTGHYILEDIWTNILTAKVILADISGSNPNVLYELGIAHTLGKKTITITHSIDQTPFDVRHFRHIKYRNSVGGHVGLVRELKNQLSELT